MKITELKPERVFYWFSRICSIPHGSGNTAEISDFCENFAKSRGLRHYRDSLGNIVIFKNGSADRAGSSPVILQGHLDMVCAKSSDCPKNMAKSGVEPVTDGKYVWAKGTTLGADDGIAVAYILAILESDDLTHPPIEAVLTVDEEIGLIGASELDCSVLRGRRAINIDSEEEGIITVSCAGGVRINCEIPLNMTEVPEKSVYIRLTAGGLLGGHSGIDIDKNRQNAVIVLARLLECIRRKFSINICTFSGGTAMNIIPPSAETVIVCPADSADWVLAAAKEFAETVKAEYRSTEPDISITAERCQGHFACADDESTKKLIFALFNAPHGITAMDAEISGMVKSSLNMGSADISGGSLKICCFARSNDNWGKQTIVEKLYSYYEYLGGTVSLSSDYPAWTYRPDSPLRDEAVRTYKAIYGSEPQIRSIHAGLECGILSAKLEDADFISFGPDIENAHTQQERLGVKSAERCYNYLIELMKNLD